MRALVAILILCEAAAAWQHPGRGQGPRVPEPRGQYVPGKALNALTDAGIPYIRAMLAPVSEGARPELITTDDRGEFLFRNVKPGAYTLACLSRDYIPSTSSRPAAIQIAENQPPPRIECSMTPLPRLAGRVVDAEDKPVAGARVQLLDPATDQGSIVTDDKGRFDWPLRPGTYAFFAEAPEGFKPPPADPAGLHAQVWARTYYPGTRFREGAQRIALRIGENPAAVELRLATSAGYMVRGRLLMDFGRFSGGPEVLLTQDSGPVNWSRDAADREKQPASRNAPREIHAQVRADGSFEFGPVAEGQWRIVAGDERRIADQWIEVSGSDVDDPRVRLGNGFPMRVYVTAREHGRRGAGDVPGFTPYVALVPHSEPPGAAAGILNWMLLPDMATPEGADDSSPSGKGAAGLRRRLLDDKGAIHLSGPGLEIDRGPERVFPGTYRVAVTPPPEPWFLDSIRVGTIDVAAGETEIAPGIGQVTVVYGNNGGTVQGRAGNCSGGFVALVPRDPARQWLGFVHSVWCDASDRYRITSVRPGEYSVLAVTGAAPPVLDPEILKQGVQVSVGAGETTSMDLVAVQPF